MITQSFLVALADPSDRHAAIARSRALGRALHVRRCRATTPNAANVARMLHEGTTLGIALFDDALTELPSLLRDGRARSIELSAFRDQRAQVQAGFQRDVGGHPASTFAIRVGTRRLAGSRLDECLQLAESIGALAVPRAAAAEQIRDVMPLAIPVYADAFPLLASELLTTWGASSVFLEAEVDGNDAPELLAWCAPRPVEYAVAIALDDDARFAELPDDVVLRWDAPGDTIWIPAPAPTPGHATTGRIAWIELAADQVTIVTEIDPARVDDVAAWLARRAQVRVTPARREAR